MTIEKNQDTKIGMIGIGKMGEAIIAGLVKMFAPENIFVNDAFQEKAEQAEKIFNVKKQTKEWIFENCNAAIIAVKPQDFAELAHKIKQLNSKNKDIIIISIMAGISINQIIEKTICKKVARVMPNLCAKIQQSSSAFTCSDCIDNEDKIIVKQILESFGISIEVQEEKIDTVTACSGSGPAFVAYLIDCFINSAVEHGIDSEKAELMCMQTFYSTSKLLIQEKIKPAELINSVSSKGGTTVAGMEVLKTSKIQQIINSTIKKAKQRSIELNKVN